MHRNTSTERIPTALSRYESIAYNRLIFRLAGYLLDRLRTPDDVCEFLRKLDGGSDSYASIFRQKDIDGFWLLNHTDVPSLVRLGIKDQNYQEKLIREIEKLRLEATQTANQTSARASDAPDCHHSNGGPTNNSYKRK